MASGQHPLVWICENQQRVNKAASIARMGCWRSTASGLVTALLLTCTGLPGDVRAGPLDAAQAVRAAETILVQRYPSRNRARARTRNQAGSSDLRVKQVERVLRGGKTLGFLVQLEPAGYLLMRADDHAPPVKLHSDSGSFNQLPRRFLEVIKDELARELDFIERRQQRNQPLAATRQAQWAALLKAEAPAVLSTPLESSSSRGPLLGMAWAQGPPYNFYCPLAGDILGMGGRAPTGCTATALAQILGYHRQPIAVFREHAYLDSSGACTGTHAIRDAGLEPYRWDLMLPVFQGNYSVEHEQAVGQLMFHAAVALESDFEAADTSAFLSMVQTAVFKQFGYLSASVDAALSYTSAQWYDKIVAEIDASRPIHYSMAQADGSGWHAAVCDGYRNGNEIHLNLGWSGSGNAWYNMEVISIDRFTWTRHYAVFGITPPGASELPAPVLEAEPLTTKGSKNIIVWRSMTGGPASQPTASQQGALISPTLIPSDSPVLMQAAAPASARSRVRLQSQPAGVELPNLAAYQPIGWSDALVLSRRRATFTDDALYDDEAVYLDWAFINNGTAQASSFDIEIYVDQVLRFRRSSGNNDPNRYSWEADLALGMLSAGPHTVMIRLDSSGLVNELNETDNDYTRAFHVLSADGPEYWAEVADNSQFVSPQSSGWVSALEFTFSGLTPGMTYWYRVKARRGASEGLWSNVEHSEQVLTGILALSGDLAFGNVPKLTSSHRTLSLANVGQEPLFVTGISFPTGFSGHWTGEIAAGAVQNVTVFFRPEELGAYEGTVVVLSDATGGTSTIEISGTGRKGYDCWLEGFFTSVDLADPAKEPTLWGALADPDQDGRSNLMEYALSLDPTLSEDAGAGIEMTATGSNPGPQRLRIKQRWNAADLEYLVEVSGDLQSWQSGYQHVRLVSRPFLPEAEYEDLLSATVGNPRFMRLRVNSR